MERRTDKPGLRATQLARITGLDERHIDQHLLAAGAMTLPGRSAPMYDAHDAAAAVADWIDAGDVEPLGALVVRLVMAGESGLLEAIDRPGSLTSVVPRLLAVHEERRARRLSQSASRSVR